jgi:hypothetical protein
VEKYCKARHDAHDNMIWRMRSAFWVTNTTDTHSESVTLIVFPRQQWLRQRTPMLRYMYTACLVIVTPAYTNNNHYTFKG